MPNTPASETDLGKKRLRIFDASENRPPAIIRDGEQRGTNAEFEWESMLPNSVLRPVCYFLLLKKEKKKKSPSRVSPRFLRPAIFSFFCFSTLFFGSSIALCLYHQLGMMPLLLILSELSGHAIF